MARQIPARYYTDSFEMVPAADLPGQAQADLDRYVDALRDSGSVIWDEEDGPAELAGLPDRINSRLQQAVIPCGRAACDLTLDLVGVATGETKILELLCTSRSFGSMDEAEAYEADCSFARQSTAAALPEFLQTTEAVCGKQ